MAIDITRPGYSGSSVASDGLPWVRHVLHEGNRTEYSISDDTREFHFSITKESEKDFVLCDFQDSWRKPCKHYKSFDNAYRGLLCLRRKYFFANSINAKA